MSSSTRTACAFESCQSTSAENRDVFVAVGKRKLPPASSSSTGKAGRAQLATQIICSTFKAAADCVHRRERWRTRCAPSEAAEAEAVRTGAVLCETNPIFRLQRRALRANWNSAGDELSDENRVAAVNWWPLPRNRASFDVMANLAIVWLECRSTSSSPQKLSKTFGASMRMFGPRYKLHSKRI